jgi:hypothetical protein
MGSTSNTTRKEDTPLESQFDSGFLKQLKEFFFFDMSTQEGGGRIRTSDIRFMRHGPQLIKLPLGYVKGAYYASHPGRT